MTKALGLIEVIGYTVAIEAADAALKAANVKFGTVTKVGAGIVTIQVFGDVGAVNAAVLAGAKAAERLGQLMAHHVIPRADDAVFDTFSNPVQKKTEPKINQLQLSYQLPPIEIKREQKEKLNYDELKKKSNSELRKMIEHSGSKGAEHSALQYMKKENLIQIILSEKDNKSFEHKPEMV